jgi:hypothetical protein
MTAARRKRDKSIDERGILERLRLLYPWFPPGMTREGDDPPDFVHNCDDKRIAIEVTRLFQEGHPTGVPRRQLESFHRKVMKRAAQIALTTSLPPLDILVYFSDREPMEMERTALALVEFARTHPVERCETFDLPEGAGVIRIAQPLGGQAPEWTCGESGAEAVLTQTQLADMIQRKNADLRRYRQGFDACWLVIASTLFPLSASFSVPRDIDRWPFKFDFDKVLLLAEPVGKVFVLRRAESGGATSLSKIKSRTR